MRFHTTPFTNVVCLHCRQLHWENNQEASCWSDTVQHPKRKRAACTRCLHIPAPRLLTQPPTGAHTTGAAYSQPQQQLHGAGPCTVSAASTTATVLLLHAYPRLHFLATDRASALALASSFFFVLRLTPPFLVPSRVYPSMLARVGLLGELPAAPVLRPRPP